MASVPLPLRNALAALVIAALRDDDAAGALTWLREPHGVPTAAAAQRLTAALLLDAHGTALAELYAEYADAIAAHAARGLAAREALAPPAPAASALDEAIDQAAALWRHGLFFEVHEVLEAVWQGSGGALRQALQGLIQVAVSFYHLAHQNRRGARTLLNDGRERLEASGTALPQVDVDALLRDTAPWQDAYQARQEPPARTPPVLCVRT
jgi:hypothetical protein